jgi:hypothetical protein
MTKFLLKVWLLSVLLVLFNTMPGVVIVALILASLTLLIVPIANKIASK